MSWVSVLWVAVAVEVVVVAADCLVWYYRTRRAYTASLQSLLLAPHGYGQGFKQGMVHAVQYHSQRSKLVQYGIMAVSWSCLISCIWVWKIGLALFLANIVGLFWFWYPAMAKAEIERVRAGGGDPVEEKNAKISHIHHEHHRGPWAPPPPPSPEETARYERQQREHAREHYVQQLTGSLIITALKSGRVMTPADAVRLANETADALGM